MLCAIHKLLFLTLCLQSLCLLSPPARDLTRPDFQTSTLLPYHRHILALHISHLQRLNHNLRRLPQLNLQHALHSGHHQHHQPIAVRTGNHPAVLRLYEYVVWLECGYYESVGGHCVDYGGGEWDQYSDGDGG